MTAQQPPHPAHWDWGYAPDKILQQTKDEHVTNRLGTDVQNIVTKVAGATTYENWAPEFEVLSQLMYFVATRVGGRQTLGEEYTDLQIVVASTPLSATRPLQATLGSVHLPSLRRLGIFAALSIGGPYLYERLQRGAARHNGRESNTRHLHRQIRRRLQHVPNTTMGRCHYTWLHAKATVLSTFWSIVSTCIRPTSTATVVATFLYHVHRMLFFFKNDYLSLPMRLTGLRQIVNREFQEGRASYSILGMLLLVRMIVGASRSTYVASRSLLHYLVPSLPPLEHGNTTAVAQQEEHQRLEELVPSFASNDAVGVPAATIPAAATHTQPEGNRLLQCLLCTEPLERPTLTPCGHLFCWDCVVPWCTKQSTCPLCRQTSTPQQLWAVRFTSVHDVPKQ
jgi:peroxin-10